jgi:hypothetical protein
MTAQTACRAFLGDGLLFERQQESRLGLVYFSFTHQTSERINAFEAFNDGWFEAIQS